MIQKIKHRVLTLLRWWLNMKLKRLTLANHSTKNKIILWIVFFSYLYIYTHKRTRALTHTHTHTHTHTLSLSLSLSLTHTHTHIYIGKIFSFFCWSKKRKTFFSKWIGPLRDLYFLKKYLFISYIRVCCQLVAFIGEHLVIY